MRSKKHLPRSPSLTRRLGLIIAAMPYIDPLLALGRSPLTSSFLCKNHSSQTSGASPATIAMRAPSKGEAHVCPVHLSEDQLRRFQAKFLGFEQQYFKQVRRQRKQTAFF